MDWIRSLNEHLRCTRKELEHQRRETSAAVARADGLEEELEMTKQHAAQQLTEMAQHLANLTDDLHALRGGSNTASPTITSTSSASKISSISISGLRPIETTPLLRKSLLDRPSHWIETPTDQGISLPPSLPFSLPFYAPSLLLQCI
ncbi:unnamed protein product [Rodentolepis nana]|uniref:PH domain-containing protein n=1 Tax=Rodentolepis nana TaxID=102285 RepID=A0A0R3T5U8_RODNA|nr:unnamed protein product [Rodentolepis nana]